MNASACPCSRAGTLALALALSLFGRPAERAWSEPIGLAVTGVAVSPAPADAAARASAWTIGVSVSNSGKRPVGLLQTGLRFVHDGRDVSPVFFIRESPENPWLVAPGARAELRYQVEGYDDAPAGQTLVAPSIRCYAAESNLLAGPDGQEAVRAADWPLSDPTQLMNATSAEEPDGPAQAHGMPAVLVTRVSGCRTRGLIQWEHAPIPAVAGTDYLLAVWYKTDRWGWNSNLDKGVTVLECGPDEAVAEHREHLVESPEWQIQWLPFKTGAGTTRLRVSLWDRAYAIKESGTWAWGRVALLRKSDISTLTAKPTGVLQVPRRPAGPSVAYLGDDWQTQGDWPARYGATYHALLGMREYHLCGGQSFPLPLSVKTGDAAVRAARWIGDLHTDDRRALRNPFDGGRTYASSDDRGETHPFDWRGPNLTCSLAIPAGAHRLALYFVDWDWATGPHPRRHRVNLRGPKGELLARAFVAAFGSGVYKSFAVKGPLPLTIEVQKDDSVCAVLSGVFLDSLSAPVLPPDRVRKLARGNAQWSSLVRERAEFLKAPVLAAARWAASARPVPGSMAKESFAEVWERMERAEAIGDRQTAQEARTVAAGHLRELPQDAYRDLVMWGRAHERGAFLAQVAGELQGIGRAIPQELYDATVAWLDAAGEDARLQQFVLDEVGRNGIRPSAAVAYRLFLRHLDAGRLADARSVDASMRELFPGAPETLLADRLLKQRAPKDAGGTQHASAP